MALRFTGINKKGEVTLYAHIASKATHRSVSYSALIGGKDFSLKLDKAAAVISELEADFSEVSPGLLMTK
jgi:hypothetical protein